VRLQDYVACITQRANPPVVGQTIAELNDFRDAPEVLHKHDGFAEGLTA
jgi:hypothetical protein